MRSELCVSIVLLCLFMFPGIAQNSSPRSQPFPSRGDVSAPSPEEDEARERMSAEMAKKAAKERVTALRSDTDKLLKLSVELKQYVDKSDENVLSLNVMKKAEEIEKLAHSVREKMKGPN